MGVLSPQLFGLLTRETHPAGPQSPVFLLHLGQTYGKLGASIPFILEFLLDAVLVAGGLGVLEAGRSGVGCSRGGRLVRAVVFAPKLVQNLGVDATDLLDGLASGVFLVSHFINDLVDGVPGIGEARDSHRG